ncbi:hypothetical protein [Breznakiella homolactica]|uniref:Uncharacterized protein n=1 Tax=Breznakiella homolactica TaxID=2798577 RepID=A0A7T8B9Y2_9SPIR|nr:hypothetical protein [Breznakiella homolactica]QQO10099.1 hypothetical protein JFL75_04050 [Breznakiella homolactica]
MSTRILFDADPDKKNPENLTSEELFDIKKDAAISLTHDIFYADGLTVYDVEKKSFLKPEVDYGFVFQDTIATEQSAWPCYRNLEFYNNYNLLRVDYRVYGDILTAADFNNIQKTTTETNILVTELEKIQSHHISSKAAHQATIDAEPDRIVLRNSRGTFNVSEPKSDYEPSIKKEMDQETWERENTDQNLQEQINTIRYSVFANVIPGETTEEEFKILYLSFDGKAYVASNTEKSHKSVIGITLEPISFNGSTDGEIEVIKSGQLIGFSGLIPGASYYLGTNGGLALREHIPSTSFKVFIGVASSDDTLEVNIGNVETDPISGSGNVELGLESLEVTQIYSRDKLFITNDTVQGRRQKKLDIGFSYLSEHSQVAHFDTDEFDQYGEPMFTVTGERILANEQQGIPITLNNSVPYVTDAKALYGKFRLQKTFPASDLFAIDFWMNYKQNADQVLFTLSMGSDIFQLEVTEKEPPYNTEKPDGIPYNSIPTDGIWYNTPEPGRTRLTRFHNNIWTSQDIILDGGDGGFEQDQWYHIGLCKNNDTLFIYINQNVMQFPVQSGNQEAIHIDVNSTLGDIAIDEFMVDPVTAEDFERFKTITVKRIPWASLDYKEKWTVFNVDDPSFFKTNIFQSADFKNAVMNILREENLNGDH